MKFVDVTSYLVATYFGLIIGNFATSFYFRIRKHITLLGFSYFHFIPPSCSSCKHFLTLKEYIPVIGYLLCRGKCNYCGEKIDYSYFIIEVFSLFLSLFCYSQFHFLDWYLIFLFFGITSLIMSIYLLKNIIVNKNFVFFSIFCGIIYKTLVTFTIYDWVFKLSVGGIICIFVMQVIHKYNLNRNHYELLKILFLGLIWFDFNLMISYALITLVNYFLLIRYQLLFARYIYCYSYLTMFIMVIINHLFRMKLL